MYLKTFALLILITSGISSFGQTYQKRLALVIGNSTYENGGTLKNPVNDARAMAASLQAMGFEVMRFENVTQTQMKQAINSFGQKLRDHEVGLFYYAGHGIQHKGTNYMIPVEADLKAEEQIEFDCVSADRVIAYMGAAATKVNLIIMDACRNNPFERSWHRSVEGSGLAMMNAPTGTLIAYATAPGTVASDGESANGLYTSMLLKFMKDPALNIEQVFKKVRTEVTDKSAGAQVPWETTSLTGGDFFLSTKPSTGGNETAQQQVENNSSSKSREIEAEGEDPEKALQYYTLAQEKYTNGKYEEAIVDYTKAIDANPLDLLSYLWRGHAKYALGIDNGDNKKLEESIIDYSKTIQLSPGDAEAYYYRGSAKKSLTKYNEAIVDFTMSIKYDPKSKDRYFQRAMAYYLLEKYGAMIEDLNKVISLAPDYALGYYWRGVGQYLLTEYALAIEDYNLAIELDATNADFFLFKGHSHLYLGEFESALKAYEKTYSINPNYAEPHYWSSRIYLLELKQKDTALKEIKKARALDPNNETYLTFYNENFK